VSLNMYSQVLLSRFVTYVFFLQLARAASGFNPRTMNLHFCLGVRAHACGCGVCVFLFVSTKRDMMMFFAAFRSRLITRPHVERLFNEKYVARYHTRSRYMTCTAPNSQCTGSQGRDWPFVSFACAVCTCTSQRILQTLPERPSYVHGAIC
jgi:hypothetical protein